jgi:hypothetical protein
MHEQFRVTLTALALCVVLYSAPASGRSSATRGSARDVPLIVCETCPHVARAAVRAGSSAATEIAALDAVEAVCTPDSPHGKWTRSIDLVETRGRLRVVPMSGVQRCGVECATVALACERILDGAGGVELGEKVFYGDGHEEKVVEWLCGEGRAAGVCERKAGRIWKGRQDGPAFVPLGETELKGEQLMDNMKGLPGLPGMKMYSANDVRDMSASELYGGGLDTDEDDDDSEGPARSQVEQIDEVLARKNARLAAEAEEAARFGILPRALATANKAKRVVSGYLNAAVGMAEAAADVMVDGARKMLATRGGSGEL